MSSASFELNYQKPYPKKKGKNRHRLFTSSMKREVEYLGSVHTYLDIFWFRNFFFPGTASVHTYPVNPCLFESALQSENVLIRYESAVVRTPRTSPVRYREGQRKTKISNLVSGTTPNWKIQPNTQNTVRGKNRREHITKSVMWKGLVQRRQILETLSASNILLHFFTTVRSPLHDFNFRRVLKYWSELK